MCAHQNHNHIVVYTYRVHTRLPECIHMFMQIQLPAEGRQTSGIRLQACIHNCIHACTHGVYMHEHTLTIHMQVHEYLHTFMQYDFLWKEDKQAAYDALMRTHPELDAFDKELQKYTEIESRINSIPPVSLFWYIYISFFV